MGGRLILLFFAMSAVLCGCSSSRVGRTGSVSINGRPVSRYGRNVRVGQLAPDFVALDMTFSPVNLNDLRGYLVVLNVVPSLDTAVCRKQTRRLLEEAPKVSPLVRVVTISSDQPFAQKRFCSDEGLEDIFVWSDAARREFGVNYGVFLADRGLLARSVFIVREDGRIAHIEIMKEMTKEPDYAEVIDILRQLL